MIKVLAIDFARNVRNEEHKIRHHPAHIAQPHRHIIYSQLFCGRHYKLEAELASMTWKIQWDEVLSTQLPRSTRGKFGSRVSVGRVSMLVSWMTGAGWFIFSYSSATNWRSCSLDAWCGVVHILSKVVLHLPRETFSFLFLM